MPDVKVVHWNPRRWDRLGRWGHSLPIGPRVANFGDLLGPLLVERIVAEASSSKPSPPRPARLLAIGSILHFARTGDTVWGSGINPKAPEREYRFTGLDVRAVRGPITLAELARLGVEAPRIFGDPALLLPRYLPWLRDYAAEKRHEITIVPNLHDTAEIASDPRVLDPRLPVHLCLERIARCHFVVGSSLHGVVVAESLGIPARFVQPKTEPEAKYRDYFGGTGRDDVDFAGTVAQAQQMGSAPPPVWDPQPLIDAFPLDLWGIESPTVRQRPDDADGAHVTA